MYVTPENFKSILLGDPGLKAQGKKVLESGPNDNVFVYFSGLGSELRVSFPEKSLFASDLISTFKEMHEKKMYNKLLFYVESGSSGSMFYYLLPSNMSIYAITSCEPMGVSYACFCKVPGYDTCLGDQYGVNWLLDSDVGKVFKGETVRQQFVKVKKETTINYPSEFGDLSIGDMPLSAFHGSVDPPPKPNPIKKCDSPIDIRDVPLHFMEQRLTRAPPEERNSLQEELDRMIEARKFAHHYGREIIKQLCFK